jgi:hypothetical protein
MLDIFLLHVTLTTHNTGEFLNLKIMELVVSLNRGHHGKGLFGILGLDRGGGGG